MDTTQPAPRPQTSGFLRRHRRVGAVVVAATAALAIPLTGAAASAAPTSCGHPTFAPVVAATTSAYVPSVGKRQV